MSPDAAAAAMRAAGMTGAVNAQPPEAIAQRGKCFQFETDRGACVFVVQVRGDLLWIDAAAARAGSGLTEAGLALAAETARQLGCKRVAFQTKRRALVKKSQAAGFRQVAYVMELTL